MDIKCPKCGQNHRVAQDLTGTQFTCQACSHVFIASETASGLSAPEPGNPGNAPSSAKTITTSSRKLSAMEIRLSGASAPPSPSTITTSSRKLSSMEIRLSGAPASPSTNTASGQKPAASEIRLSGASPSSSLPPPNLAFKKKEVPPPPPPEEMAPKPAVPEKKKPLKKKKPPTGKSGAGLQILIAVILLFLAGGGFYAYKVIKEKEQKKIAEEKARKEKEAEEKLRKEKAARLAEKKRKLAEKRRIEEEKRLREEKKRLEELLENERRKNKTGPVSKQLPVPPPKPKGRKKLTPLPLPPKQVAVSDPARYRDHISFYAQMEGSGEFIITGDKIEYIHGSGVEPLAAVVNGRVWKDIYSDFPLRNFYDFQRAKVEQKTGRGVISLERNRADIRIYINDSPPGVGEYTMKITFPETTPLPDRPARQKSLYEIFFDRNFFSAGSVRIPSSRNLSRRVRMVSRPAEIPGNAVLMKTLYLPPFTISAELKPHRSNVRFMLCGGEIIFNSETDPRTLLVNIPGILPQKREKAGWLENEEWQKIRIEVKTNSVRIYVNKTLRYLGTGTVSAQKEMIGIYSTFDGSVDLKSFFVSDSVSSD